MVLMSDWMPAGAVGDSPAVTVSGDQIPSHSLLLHSTCCFSWSLTYSVSPSGVASTSPLSVSRIDTDVAFEPESVDDSALSDPQPARVRTAIKTAGKAPRRSRV